MPRLRELAMAGLVAMGAMLGIAASPAPARADEVVLVHDRWRHRPPPPPHWRRPPPPRYYHGPPRAYYRPPPRAWYPPPPRYYRPPPPPPGYYYRY